MFWRDALVLLSYTDMQTATLSNPAASHVYLGKHSGAILDPSSPLISFKKSEKLEKKINSRNPNSGIFNYFD